MHGVLAVVRRRHAGAAVARGGERRGGSPPARRSRGAHRPQCPGSVVFWVYACDSNLFYGNALTCFWVLLPTACTTKPRKAHCSHCYVPASKAYASCSCACACAFACARPRAPWPPSARRPSGVARGATIPRPGPLWAQCRIEYVCNSGADHRCALYHGRSASAPNIASVIPGGGSA